MRDGLGQLVGAEAVVHGALQVKRELADAVQRDQRRDGDQAAVARGQTGALPDVSKQHVLRVARESRGVALEGGALGAAGGV